MAFEQSCHIGVQLRHLKHIGKRFDPVENPLMIEVWIHTEQRDDIISIYLAMRSRLHHDHIFWCRQRNQYVCNAHYVGTFYRFHLEGKTPQRQIDGYTRWRMLQQQNTMSFRKREYP